MAQYVFHNEALPGPLLVCLLPGACLERASEEGMSGSTERNNLTSDNRLLARWPPMFCSRQLSRLLSFCSAFSGDLRQLSIFCLNQFFSKQFSLAILRKLLWRAHLCRSEARSFILHIKPYQSLQAPLLSHESASVTPGL